MARLARLEVEERTFAFDPHPDRGLLRSVGHRGQVVDIALGHRLDPFGRRPPAFAGDPELAFDLDAHAVVRPPVSAP
jgi:hypothetical protein